MTLQTMSNQVLTADFTYLLNTEKETLLYI